MRSKKMWAVLILLAVVLGGVGAGGAYLVLTLRENKRAQQFDLVRAALDDANWEQAKLVLDGMLDGGSGREAWYAEALGLQLQMQRDQAAAMTADFRHDEADAMAAQARVTAEMLLDENARRRGPAVLDARAYLGWTALEEDDIRTAAAHFEAILAASGRTGHGADVARLGQARIELADRGLELDTLEELLDVHATFPDSDYREEIEHVIGVCNTQMLFSKRLFRENDQIYVVQNGDTIYDIAKAHGIPQDLLLRVNGMTAADARRLTLSKRLKIPDVAFDIVVDKSDNTLTLRNHGDFFKRYMVRTGIEEWQTPVGEYKVQSKKVNPQWSDPDSGRTFAPNAPGNELGTRWIGFLDPGLGIHGTIHAETVGSYASNGCVGMYKEDVEELFDLVSYGTPVRIVGRARRVR